MRTPRVVLDELRSRLDVILSRDAGDLSSQAPAIGEELVEYGVRAARGRLQYLYRLQLLVDGEVVTGLVIADCYSAAERITREWAAGWTETVARPLAPQMISWRELLSGEVR